MGMRTGIGASILLGGLIAIGCSGGSDSSSSNGNFGERYCGLFRPCCDKAGLPVTNQQACKLLFGSAQAKDQAAAEECISQYEAWAQEADWCDTFANKPRPASCEKAYPEQPSNGTKKPGETCSASDDCAASSKGEVECYSDFSGTGNHYCRVVVNAESGGACVGTRSDNITVYEGNTSGALELAICDRADGLFCDSGTCVPVVSEGGTCTSSFSCAGDTLYCGSGTCQAKVGVGSSCQASSSACADEAYCDFSTQICQARLPDGSSCTSLEQCQSSYCDGNVCAQFNGFGDLTLSIFCN